MIQFVFSHLWVVIFATIFVLGEFAFWYDAVDKFKRRDDPEDVVELIGIHAIVIGIGSFIYWITLIAK